MEHTKHTKNEFFEADKRGQYKVLSTICETLYKSNSVKVLTFNLNYDNYSPIDIYIRVLTESDNMYSYAIECKDRNCKHTDFAEEGFLITTQKLMKLLEAAAEGYKPLYLNSFTDGYFVIWDLSKIKITDLGITRKKAFPKTTINNESHKVVEEQRLTLKLKDCVYCGKLNESQKVS